MSSKVEPLSDAVASLVEPGDTVFVGGFGHAIPFATGHEIIRQGIDGLTLCRSGADILFDQMIAAGCVDRLIVGWIGNPGLGLSHGFRRSLAAGRVELEEWTNFTLVLRLHAAELGVPFLPARVLRDGDTRAAAVHVRDVEDPFSGERLTAVPALTPDVALVHAQRADESGNVQMWGITGDTVTGAMASKRVLVTVEEVVSPEVIARDPNRTVLHAHEVDSVVEVPWGAHPSYVQGHYTRDDAAYRSYDEISRSDETLRDYLDEWVFKVSGRSEYIEKVEVSALGVPNRPVSGVNYGFEP